MKPLYILGLKQIDKICHSGENLGDILYSKRLSFLLNDTCEAILRKSYIVFFFSLLYLSACNNYNHYPLFVIFDNVHGLRTGTEVQVKGMKVGNVTAMKLFKNKILVTLSIEKDVQIPKNSVCEIELPSLMGEAIITVEPDNIAKDFYHAQDTLQGISPKEQERNLVPIEIDSVRLKQLKPMVDSLANAIIQLGKDLSKNHR